MKKAFYKINNRVNPEIKVGDTVRLVDGSGLARTVNDGTDYYIIKSYPSLTNSYVPLKDLQFKVIEVGITDVITGVEGMLETCYGADIRIGLDDSDVEFYRCSEFVVKVTKDNLDINIRPYKIILFH